MRVMVTGAARAIGAATVTELATRGHEVVATARDPSLLDGLPAARHLALDVTDEESVRAAHAAAGEVDAIVNNAAVAAPGPLEAVPPAVLVAVLDTNAVGPLRVLQPVLPQWRARGSGVVVNISSIQGKVAVPLDAAYSASKHALEALSEALAHELGHFGIRVVLVEPGYVAPGMKQHAAFPGPAAYDPLRSQLTGLDRAIQGPGGRPGPETVAEAVADALERGDTPLRVEVGDDARVVLDARRSLDDARFEAAMRELLGITW